MNRKELDIRNVQQQTGAAYSDFKWLDEREAIRANKRRDHLLRSLPDGITHSFLESKIHSGELSRGCAICGEGNWSCLFINALCNADCFFCPQDRGITEESPPTAEEIVFDDPEHYVDYLERFGFKGVGFSGGEPITVFDKVLVYLDRIRDRFGQHMHVWLYTNGLSVDRRHLQELKNAGLDEIRFNIL